MFWNFLYRIFKVLSSLELAVCVILSLAVILATGTIYESKYGAEIASKMVYRSFWMQGILWVLILNLAAVAMSRLPWKKHHVGFLITHLGIIILLLGSFITQRAGLDGSMLLPPGGSSRYVRVNENMLNIFRATPGKNYELLLSERLDFNPLEPFKKPVHYSLKEKSGQALPFEVIQYYPKASRSVSAETDPSGKGVPAVHFSLAGSRATISDWFFQTDASNVRQYGPAEFRFLKEKPDSRVLPDKPTLFLYTEKNSSGMPSLAVFARGDKKIRLLGPIHLNQPMQLGWMDFAFVVDEYKPSAVPSVVYSPSEKSGPMAETFEVIQVALNGEKLWLELGSSGQIAKGDGLYYIQYGKKEVDLGFDVTLKNFKVGFYQGTTRPESYSSVVSVAGNEQVISMNEPMKKEGFTFYQASYETDESGQPRFSVLSVNHDPGRPIKYTGCLMIVFGIISMFYFKPKYSGKHKLLKKTEGASA